MTLCPWRPKAHQLVFTASSPCVVLPLTLSSFLPPFPRFLPLYVLPVHILPSSPSFLPSSSPPPLPFPSHLPHLSTSLFAAFVLLTFPFPIFPSSSSLHLHLSFSPSPSLSPPVPSSFLSHLLPSLSTAFAPLPSPSLPLSFSPTPLLSPPLLFPSLSPLLRSPSLPQLPASLYLLCPPRRC